MKKIILFFVATLLLSSCSKDADTTISPTDSGKTYPVNFKVNSSDFNLDVSPLRSLEDGELVVVQMLIYSETGSLFHTQFVSSSKFERSLRLAGEDGTVNFTTELPAGNFYYAFIASKTDPSHPVGYKNVLMASNFNTDYYTDQEMDYSTGRLQYYTATFDNGACYFESGALTVGATDEPQDLSIGLKPMWSQLKVAINDAQTFDVPAGTNAVEFVVAPHYYGYGIESKLATLPYPREDRPNIVSLDSIRANPTFEFTSILSKTTTENNNIGVTINYIKKEGDTNTVLQSRELRMPQTQLENGYYYNIGGNLGSTANNQSMSISLGSFNPENVIIEF